MALGKTRVTLGGETAFAHEREALEFAIEQLPNNDPYQVWGLVELLEPATGRLYEIDLLVLGHNALYLVEIKSGPGTYVGDAVDWWRRVPEERDRYMENPYRLTNHKAKVLASLLERRMKRVPWIQPLVFLSHPEARIALADEGKVGVVTCNSFLRAVTHHEFPGAPQNRHIRPVDKVQARDLAAALQALGIRPRKGKLHVGEYELGDVLEDGQSYQDRLAVHRDRPTIRRRARIYLVPQQTSVERRSLLRRAADREAAILDELREHVGVLQFAGYVADAPLGPTVLFDAFDGGLRLDAFLRQNPTLSFPERLELVAQVGRALGYCHRKAILHGGLSPESVLVRRGTNGGLEVRLFNFQLGAAADRVDATAHVSALTGQTGLLYQPPEVRENPLRREVEGDLFSLGALAYLVLTGQPPASDTLELDARLEREGHLDPSTTDDAIPPGVARVVAEATKLRPVERYNDALEWVELLLDAGTAPDKPLIADYVDPLFAREGDRIAPDLEVIKAVGQGATARVLRVRKDDLDRELALKVSLGPGHDDRIRAEGSTLKRLDETRIIQCLEVREVGGRAALLLPFVRQTLLQRLADEGPIVLDYAIRWGEDLLQALVELERADLTHRDIKPANIGIGGPSNQTERLILLDFSLSQSDPRAIDAGTAAYRDPFLRTRGAWDAAADRWSAALVLHEMLTATRPTFSEGSSSVDPAAKIVLAADRFPPGMREGLVAFFERAFQRDTAQRFASAESMRRAWGRFAPDEGHVDTDAGIRRPAVPPLTDEEIAQIAGDAMIASVRFDERAKNALDRAGVLRVRDLLRLPQNRLSAIRGVGRDVARSILDFRDRWTRLRGEAEAPSHPFYPGYRGEDLPLEAAGLEPAMREPLGDAGLRTTAMVAGAPEDQIKTIAERRKFDAAALMRMLDTEHRRGEERAHPTTLEGWVDALLPPKKKAFRKARMLFGLDPLTDDSGAELAPSLALGASGGRLAKALGQTAPAIYIALGKDRVKWGAHPAMDELVAMARRVVEERGGAAPLADAADRLLAVLPHDRSRDAARLQLEAAAILRVVSELRVADEQGEERAVVELFRVDDAAWLTLDPTVPPIVRALGAAATALAARDPLASPAEAQRILTEAAGQSELARLPFEQLAWIGARASRTAACSTRLELYPRGMDPRRALEMTAALITNGIGPEEVQRRVRDRYPDAGPVPDRPELDALLEQRFQLHWIETEGVYRRPGSGVTTTQHTSFAATVHQVAPTPLSPVEDLGAREFEERLRHAVEKRLLRVLPVHAHRVKAAERRLARFLQVPVRPLDLLLIEAIERHAAAMKVQPAAVHVADREGPAGKNWKKLLKLAELGAKDLLASLLPAREPLLLTSPGLVARYQLKGFLDALVAASKRDENAAIFLVLPSHDRNAAPVINGELPIPGLLASERLWVPSSWIGSASTVQAAPASNLHGRP